MKERKYEKTPPKKIERPYRPGTIGNRRPEVLKKHIKRA